MERVHREERQLLRSEPGGLRRSVGERLRPLRGARVTAKRLTSSNLGERVSILFRIEGDAEHPFSEVVGVLQRIDPDPTTYHVVRRSGEVVEVPEDSVVTLKLMPAARGPLRAPKSWSETSE